MGIFPWSICYQVSYSGFIFCLEECPNLLVFQFFHVALTTTMENSTTYSNPVCMGRIIDLKFKQSVHMIQLLLMVLFLQTSSTFLNLFWFRERLLSSMKSRYFKPSEFFTDYPFEVNIDSINILMAHSLCFV